MQQARRRLVALDTSSPERPYSSSGAADSDGATFNDPLAATSPARVEHEAPTTNVAARGGSQASNDGAYEHGHNHDGDTGVELLRSARNTGRKKRKARRRRKRQAVAAASPPPPPLPSTLKHTRSAVRLPSDAGALDRLEVESGLQRRSESLADMRRSAKRMVASTNSGTATGTRRSHAGSVGGRSAASSSSNNRQLAPLPGFSPMKSGKRRSWEENLNSVDMALTTEELEERSKKFRSNNQLEAKYKVKFERRLAKLRLQKSAVSKAERDVERVHSLVQQANQRMKGMQDRIEQQVLRAEEGQLALAEQRAALESKLVQLREDRLGIMKRGRELDRREAELHNQEAELTKEYEKISGIRQSADDYARVVHAQIQSEKQAATEATERAQRAEADIKRRRAECAKKEQALRLRAAELDEQEAATEKTAKHAKATLAAAQGIERRFDAKEAAVAQARQSLLVRERTVQEKEVEAARVALENKERTQELARSRLKVAANRTRLQDTSRRERALAELQASLDKRAEELEEMAAVVERSRQEANVKIEEAAAAVAAMNEHKAVHAKESTRLKRLGDKLRRQKAENRAQLAAIDTAKMQGLLPRRPAAAPQRKPRVAVAAVAKLATPTTKS